MKCNSILIDLDNTLYDYDTAHLAAINVVSHYLSLELGISSSKIEQTYYNARKEINIELSKTAASHNRMLYFQRMLEQLGKIDVSLCLKIYELYWNTFLNNMPLMNGVNNFFEMVKDLKICIVTNLTAHIQFRKIEKLKINQYINYIVTSEEAGVEKPHPAPFVLALKKLNCTPDEVVMIGENFNDDIVGATNLGIKSFWLNKTSNKKPENDLITEFSDFNELMRHFQ
ncbi:MAG: HAD family hydrolase [Bacteroidota bacterium]|nr:HAD family hydrolase [Bacteroidota bacterium]